VLRTNEHITDEIQLNNITAIRIKTAYLVFSKLHKLKHFYVNQLERKFNFFDDKQQQEQTNDEEYNH
jgi:hypothetical protein